MSNIVSSIALRVAGKSTAARQTFTSSASPNRSQLPAPFVLPQQGYDSDSPFIRGYASELHHVGVSESTFIAFVDNLNAAMVKSPEAQALTVASYAGSLLL